MTSAEFTAKLRSIIIQRGAQDKILNAIENEPSMSPATFNNFMKKKSSRVTMVQAMFYLETLNGGLILRNESYTCIALCYEDILVAISCLREIIGAKVVETWDIKNKEKGQINLFIAEFFRVCKKLNTTPEFVFRSQELQK